MLCSARIFPGNRTDAFATGSRVIVQQGDRLNVRADVSEAEPSAQMTAVNTFGGLQRDRGAMLGRMSAVLPVGFCYKAFCTRRLFPMWERMFRRLTGLGRVDFAAPRLRTPKQYGFCDVLVIGAGPSGLAAAVAAGEAGARVVVVDENARPGGSGFYQLGGDARTRAATQALLDRIGALPKVQLLSGTCAAGYYADHWVPLIDAGRLTKMRAGAVVVASGAFEQPAVFRNNDLPGVMLASAAQRVIYRYAVQPMRRRGFAMPASKRSSGPAYTKRSPIRTQARSPPRGSAGSPQTVSRIRPRCARSNAMAW